MIQFTISRSSIDAVSNHIKNVKQRVLVGIRLGMRDGIRGLARAEVEAVAGHRRTGLLERILSRGGCVIESGEQISAVYRPRSPDKQEHYWLEYGVKVPALKGRCKLDTCRRSEFCISGIPGHAPEKGAVDLNFRDRAVGCAILSLASH